MRQNQPAGETPGERHLLDEPLTQREYRAQLTAGTQNKIKPWWIFELSQTNSRHLYSVSQMSRDSERLILFSSFLFVSLLTLKLIMNDSLILF